MKNISKIYSIALLCSLSLLFGCTKDFEKLNTDPKGLSNQQTLNQIQTAIGPIESNYWLGWQIAQNLSADAYAGYTMSPTSSFGVSNLSYSIKDNWNTSGFDGVYTTVMGPVRALARAGARTSIPEIWGVALLIQVDIVARATDKFGPMPYTKAGSDYRTIPYDDQKTIYTEFFKQIDTAVGNMHTFLASSAPIKNKMGTSDLIYGGDLNKWVKFANSLRLRLAMRIVKADPVLAKSQGEIALAAPEGLLAVNTDNALLYGSLNQIYQCTLVYGGDNMLGASFGSYLDGYKDPRAPKMVLAATQPGIVGSYTGIRLGVDVDKGDYHKFSMHNYKDSFTQFAPYIVMTAAEMWFLKAEAALRGWSGAGDTKTNYETGIQISMDQWGVPIGSYLSDATSKQANYVDPLNTDNNINALSTITIKWDDEATNEQKLERIITQKWVAIFPDGYQSWAEYRRTGYPKLFPVARNFSNGTIDTQIQIRRLPFPESQKVADKAGYASGVAALGGTDNGGTRLWWDKAGPNF